MLHTGETFATKAEINFTLADASFTLAEVNFTKAEANFTLAEMNFTLAHTRVNDMVISVLRHIRRIRLV